MGDMHEDREIQEEANWQVSDICGFPQMESLERQYTLHYMYFIEPNKCILFRQLWNLCVKPRIGMSQLICNI